MKTLRRVISYTLLVMLVITGAVLWTRQNAVLDWLRLSNYTPNSQIAALATQTTMTSQAKKYFYVNQPEVLGRVEFNKQCTNKTEQAVVLGCFHGNRQGIFIFNVTTTELNGVQQVTAAHEMLHQAYQRLSDRDKTSVDTELQNYFNNSLTDQTIKDQMAGYKKSEPDAYMDEMHSVLGTEVANLPPSLEKYFSQYFSNRKVVTDYYAQYQAAFTSRNQQILEYDSHLAAQKQQIESLQSQLASQLQTLNSRKTQMDQKRSSGDIAGYNAMVDTYNQLVDSYNAQLETLRAEIDGYNKLVAARNAIAVQEQQLQQDLSSQALPSIPSQ